MDHPLPWLKYTEAHNIDEAFDELPVVDPRGENLGKVDGFIVDSDSARPYYAVVDAGGWFKSKHFLLPIGHARLVSDAEGDTLEADIDRGRIDRFPGFDKDEFEKLTPAAIKKLNDTICVACAIVAQDYAADEPFSAAWDRDDYQKPDWWHAEPHLPERMGESVEKKMTQYPPSR
jgi:hypothetical protein